MRRRVSKWKAVEEMVRRGMKVEEEGRCNEEAVYLEVL